MVRVGGGYLVIEEFIDNYAEAEEHKLEMKIERGEDPFGMETYKSEGGKKQVSRSPRSRRNRGNIAV